MAALLFISPARVPGDVQLLCCALAGKDVSLAAYQNFTDDVPRGSLCNNSDVVTHSIDVGPACGSDPRQKLVEGYVRHVIGRIADLRSGCPYLGFKWISGGTWLLFLDVEEEKERY